MEIILSIISVFLQEYRTKKELKKVVFETEKRQYRGNNPEDYRIILEAYNKTKKQAIYRQIFSCLGGNSCRIDWHGNAENITHSHIHVVYEKKK